MKYWLAVVMGVWATTGTLAAHADSVLLLKTGIYELKEPVQYSEVQYPPETLVFADEADQVYAIEYEWRNRQGFAIGAEYFSFANDWVSSRAGRRGELSAFTLTFNAKKYFAPTRWLLPYLGGGIGWAGANLESPTEDTGLVGLVVQGLAGVEFKVAKHLGLYTQAKFVSSKVEDGYDDGLTISGTAYTAGLAIHF